MLKVLYKNGSIDGNTFELDPAIYEGQDPMVAALNETVMSLQGGRLATMGADGYVTLGSNDNVMGVIVNDAAGVPLFDKPALGSGKVPLMFGGGLIETDQVIEANIVPQDKLYCGANGQWTKVDPTGDGTGIVYGVAVSSNSATNKTLKIQSRV